MLLRIRFGMQDVFTAQSPCRVFHTPLITRMKLKHTLSISLFFALGAAASLRAQEVKLPTAGAQPAPAAVPAAAQFTEAQMFDLT